MASNKRKPTSELNHDNWKEFLDEEPDEEGAGEFKQATVEEIRQRKIIKPKRRLQNNEPGVSANPFSSIAFGFGAPITASASPPVVAPADSITAAASDDSNSGPGEAVAQGEAAPADSSSSLPARAENVDRGQVAASSSSCLDTNESANTNGDLRQASANDDPSSEADACSRDSLPENLARYEVGLPDYDEIASSSNNADNEEESSNDVYYRDPVEDSNSVDVEHPEQSDSKNGDDIDSTVQEQN